MEVSVLSVAIFHSSVPHPVATTTPIAFPVATVVPIKHILVRSPSSVSLGIACLCFLFGLDSPVSEKSLVCKLCSSIILMSAGMVSPSCMIRISQGTISSASISCT